MFANLFFWQILRMRIKVLNCRVQVTMYPGN
jgi:hypothetical protein